MSAPNPAIRTRARILDLALLAVVLLTLLATAAMFFGVLGD